LEKAGLPAFFSFKIADCAWTGSSSVRNRRYAWTGDAVCASSTSPGVNGAPCAPTVFFGADEKRTRTKNTVMDKNRNILE